MRFFIIFFLVFCCFCSYGQENIVLFKTLNLESLHHKILSKVFKKYFIYPRERIKARFYPDAIWLAAGENKELFTNLVADKRVNLDFRLATYWVLRIKFGKAAIDFFDKKMLSQLFYDSFLAENYYEHWSFTRELHPPFELKRLGELVEMLVELGDVSIPLWYKILDNNKIMLPNCDEGMALRCPKYNSNIIVFNYHYNDYAAFYLSLITNIELPFHKNYSERLTRIAFFKIKIQLYCAYRGISLE